MSLLGALLSFRNTERGMRPGSRLIKIKRRVEGERLDRGLEWPLGQDKSFLIMDTYYHPIS